MKKKLEIIAVVGNDNSIGRKGDLIKHLPEDLRRFKTVTMGGTVIMGRKTWDSLPRKPLPGRVNIIISRNPDFNPQSAFRASSLAEALEIAEKKAPDARIFIIGGGEIYRQAFPYADILHLTLLKEGCKDADTFFPVIDETEWRLTRSEPGQEGDYTFDTFERVNSE